MVADDGQQLLRSNHYIVRGFVVPAWLVRVRPWLAVAAVVLIAGMLLPPLGSYAREYEFVESLQFAVFAVAAPALLMLGAPWRFLGLSRRPGRDSGRPPGLADRLARSRGAGVGRAAVALVAFIMLAIAWRLPATVNALARDPGVAVAEMATLIAGGSGVWLELVESPPLLPRLSRPQRAAMAAVAMWTIWVLAYIMGMSKAAWFAAHSHAAADGLSTAADQQVAVGILWAVPALCFAPVIYGVLMTWLRDSQDPDEELRSAGAADAAHAGLSGWPRPPRGWQPPSA
jgi:cytochrome c oxidase assembly factor CtaG